MNAVTENVMQRRAACGYQLPNQRARCGQCDNGVTPDGGKDWSVTVFCLKHDFRAHRKAICNDFAGSGPSKAAR